MNRRLNADIWQIVNEFPGDWQRMGEHGASKLVIPGFTLTVGPNGFSGSTGGGPLSINVSIIRESDRIPGCSSTPIAFSRIYSNRGHTTGYPPSPKPTRSLYERTWRELTPPEWLRESLAEAFEWLELQPPQPPPSPQPSPPSPPRLPKIGEVLAKIWEGWK